MANNILLEKIKSLKSSTSNSNKHKVSKKQKSTVSSNSEELITVDPLTDHPTHAWEKMRDSHRKLQLDPDSFRMKPQEDNVLRFVCLSDTHGAVEQARREFHKRVPDGDVLIHCGDFTMGGDPSEITAFDSFIAHLPHPVKLVIAGNHELTFEDASYGVHPVMVRKKLGLPIKASSQEVVDGCKALLEHALYLEDETISICGINIYASPWVPTFGSWGFSISRGHRLLEKWNQIPSDTDILITHGPPCGYGDHIGNTNHAGCVELLNTVVKRVKPKFHVFGHIHSGYGMWTNGKTTFINSAICSNKYKPDHDPIVFDYPLPRGYSRQDFAHLSTESLRQARDTAMQQHTEQNGCDSGNSDSGMVNGESLHTADDLQHRPQREGSTSRPDGAASGFRCSGGGEKSERKNSKTEDNHSDCAAKMSDLTLH